MILLKMFLFILLHHTWYLVPWIGDFSQTRQVLWFPKDDLKDPSTWSSPPFVLLRDIHDGLLTKYDFKDTVPPQSQSDTRASVGLSQQDGDTQKETLPLLLPQLTRLHEAYHVRGEDVSNMPNDGRRRYQGTSTN